MKYILLIGAFVISCLVAVYIMEPREEEVLGGVDETVNPLFEIGGDIQFSGDVQFGL